MTMRRLAPLWLALIALHAAPPAPATVLDDVPDDDEAPAPPRPVPPPPPPAPRPEPPPPPPPPPEPPRRVETPPRPVPPPVIERDYEPSGFLFAPELLALEFDTGEQAYGTDLTSGETYSIDDEDLDLGWRLGLGYRWRNGWDFVVRGTRVDSSDAESATADGPAGIGTTFAAGIDASEARLDIDYMTLDAEVGHTWGAWERSHVRLFFGPRYASIEQKLWTIHDPDTGVGGDTWATTESLDMDAIGLRVGIEGTIAFGPNWALVLTGAAGGYDADFDDDMLRTSSDGAVVEASSSTEDGDTITSLEASAALRWQRQAFEDGMFAIRFGWEFAHWNDVPSTSDLASSSGPSFRDEDFEADGPFIRFEWIF